MKQILFITAALLSFALGSSFLLSAAVLSSNAPSASTQSHSDSGTYTPQPSVPMKGPEVVKNFLEHVDQGKSAGYHKAYQLLSQVMRDLYTEEEWAKGIEKSRAPFPGNPRRELQEDTGSKVTYLTRFVQMNPFSWKEAKEVIYYYNTKTIQPSIGMYTIQEAR